MAGTWLRRLFRAFSLVTIISAASLAPHFGDSAELVRLRNALLLDDEAASYDWSPENVAEGFALETNAPNPLYVEVVKREGLRSDGRDWETALRIAQHLLKNQTSRGGAIQASLDDTYRRITKQGGGYCGDFADVFTGLAHAAGIFSRSWAFSFDGFGGQGHIVNEIWDRSGKRWIMIDVFNNIYFTDPAGMALSAAQLRAGLAAGAPVRLVPIAPEVAPGFKYESKALEYYRRGLPEWYMWWGNNVFANDQAPLVRAFSSAHRALEQSAAIAQGVAPRIRIVDDDRSGDARAALGRLRTHLHLVAVLAGLSLIFGVFSLMTRFCRRHGKVPAVSLREGA